MDVVSMDLMGPFVQSARGNKYLLVLRDHFTRWVVVVPIPSKKAQDVCEALERNFLMIFGFPKHMLCDQGREFTAALTRRILARTGVKQMFTTAYHPQGNGKVERVNAFINAAMRAYVDKYHADWDLYANAIAYAYNTSYVEPIKTSPYELVFGRKADGPAERQYETQLIRADVDTYNTRMTARLKEAYQQVREHQKRAAEEMKAIKNAKREESKLQVGDAVWLYDPRIVTGLPKRCQTHWLPRQYHIVDIPTDPKQSGVVVTIADSDGKQQKVHVSRLKKYNGYNP